jgi:hypothetical protein
MSHQEGKRNFITWLKQIQMLEEIGDIIFWTSIYLDGRKKQSNRGSNGAISF